MSGSPTTEFSYALYETVTRAPSATTTQRTPRSTRRRGKSPRKGIQASAVFMPYPMDTPREITAFVVEKTAYDTYSMIDVAVIRALTEKLANPGDADEVIMNAADHEIGSKCVVRTAGDHALESLPYHHGVLRGLLRDVFMANKTCKVILVDYGRTIVCSVSRVFHWKGQSDEVSSAPIAHFSCRITEVTPQRRNGRKTVELSTDTTYRVSVVRAVSSDVLAGTAAVPFAWKTTERDKEENVALNASESMSTPSCDDHMDMLMCKKKVEEEEEALHLERIAFEQECMEREKEVALMAMQMQLMDVSTRVNAIMASSLPVNTTFPSNVNMLSCQVPCSQPVTQRSPAVCAPLGIEWPQLKAHDGPPPREKPMHTVDTRAPLRCAPSEVAVQYELAHSMQPVTPRRSPLETTAADSRGDRKSIGISPTEGSVSLSTTVKPSGSCNTMLSSTSLVSTMSLSSDNDTSTITSLSECAAHVKRPCEFPCIRVKSGVEMSVRRCDGDEHNSQWPLFFVRLFKDKAVAAAASEVEFLSPISLCEPDSLHIGLVCMAYSRTFRRHLRAVLIKLTLDKAEVHFIDRGNNETVDRSQLWSVHDQASSVGLQSGLALPCVMQEMDDLGGGEFERFDEDTLQEAVSCKHRSFQLRLIKQRRDGVALVQLV